jgi:preprotein translocase subunit SecG
MLSFFFYLTMVLFLVVCVFLVLLVLIQKGRGGGLASAFGGAGGNTAFGSKTGDVLTWATSVVFGIFLVLAIAMNLLANHVHERRTGIAGGSNTTAAQTPADEQETPGSGAPRSTVPPAVPDPGVRDEQVPPAARGATPAPDRTTSAPKAITSPTQPTTAPQ